MIRCVNRQIRNPIPVINAAINNKLLCAEQYPFRQDLLELEAELCASQLPAFTIDRAVGEVASKSENCLVYEGTLAELTGASFGGYPVLILSGQFDTSTPPAWSEKAAELLPGAQLVKVPNAGHSLLGRYGSCPTEISMKFLAEPGRAVDSSCTQEMGVRWVLPDTVIGSPVPDE